MTRVLITGDRQYKCLPLAQAILARLRARYGPDLIVVHGDAYGVDRSFKDACWGMGIRTEAHPAPWTEHGRAAGPIRNAEMVAAGAAFCLAVHADLAHSSGTGDCVRRCLAAGIPVWHIDPSVGDETPHRLTEAL